MVPPTAAGATAVLSFTAHIVVCADVDLSWVRERLAPGELSEAFTPPFLGAPATHLGRRVNAIDAVLLAPRAGRAVVGVDLTPASEDHPRVRRARGAIARTWRPGRRQAASWCSAAGSPAGGRSRSRWIRRTATVGWAEPWPAPPGPWWPTTIHCGQVSPGNAASLRAFLAAGYAPVGVEALLVDHGRRDWTRLVRV